MHYTKQTEEGPKIDRNAILPSNLLTHWELVQHSVRMFREVYNSQKPKERKKGKKGVRTRMKYFSFDGSSISSGVNFDKLTLTEAPLSYFGIPISAEMLTLLLNSGCSMEGLQPLCKVLEIDPRAKNSADALKERISNGLKFRKGGGVLTDSEFQVKYQKGPSAADLRTVDEANIVGLEKERNALKVSEKVEQAFLSEEMEGLQKLWPSSPNVEENFKSENIPGIWGIPLKTRVPITWEILKALKEVTKSIEAITASLEGEDNE